MAGETVIGALRYDFTADTSGLKSGLAEAQEGLKKVTAGVKNSSGALSDLGKTATQSVSKIAPAVSESQNKLRDLSSQAAQSGKIIQDEFKAVGDQIKKVNDQISRPQAPAFKPPPPPDPPKPTRSNDNDPIIGGLQKWNEARYDMIGRLSAAAKSTGNDFHDLGKKAASSAGLAQHEILNLTRQVNDLGVSLAGGMSPFMVLMQQGPQIAEIFQGTKASIASIGAQIVGSVTKAVFSLRGIGLAVTGVFAGVELAASVARSKLADLAEQAKKSSVSVETLMGAQIKGAKVGLSNDDVSAGLEGASKAFEDYKRNAGSVVDTVKEIDKSFLTSLDSTRSFGEWLDVIAAKIQTLPATQARDLAESLFPADKAAKFIDLIKQGEFSIASFNRAAGAAGGGFATIANDAADLRIKLAAADEEVNSRLLVSLAKLPTPLGNFASIWTDIKAKIADLIPVIADWISAAQSGISSVRDAYNLLKETISEIAQAIRDDLQGAIAALGGPMDAFASAWDFVSGKVNAVIDGVNRLKAAYGEAAKAADALIVGDKQPQRGPLPLLAGGFSAGSTASKFKPSDMFLSTVGELKGPKAGDTRAKYEAAQEANKDHKSKADTDKIKQYIDNLKESAAVAQAEADSWKLGNVEREKAMALVKAENIAKQEGRSLTEAQRTEILMLAGQQESAKQRIEDMKDAQSRLNDAMREFGSTVSSSLESLIIRGQKASDVLRDLVKQLASSALKGLLTGEGMFGSLLGLSGSKENGSTGLGGLLGKALSFLPKFAEGGNLGAGKWGIAGEAGPELVKGPAQIVPFGKMGGNGQPKVTVHNYAGADVQARQMSDGEIFVIVNSMIQANNKKVPGIIADSQRRGM